MLDWFNSREAAQTGIALADEYAPRAAESGSPDALEQLLRRVDTEVRPMHLNFYKKAKFANAFKWRLIENDVPRESAAEITQSLILHLSQSQIPVPSQDSAAMPTGRSERAKAQDLFSRGNKSFVNAGYADAAALYEKAIELNPAHSEAMNNLGASLIELNRQEEAEQCFRQAIAVNPNFADPYCNLGVLLRSKSDLTGAEAALRRALKLKPNFIEARINLGLTLALFGRLRDAKSYLAKALKKAPRNIEALYGMGQLAVFEGRFDEAEAVFKHVIEIDPKMPGAWAAIVGLRKMTAADGEWLKNAAVVANSGLHPLAEANVRFAIGKYCDDVGDFDQAFENYKRGNELAKSGAPDYERQERTRLVDDMIRVYSRDAISKIQGSGSDSAKPVFIVGMPRSGTSLAEQILASTPGAHGAGELMFWESLVAGDKGIRQHILSEPQRSRAAEAYLSTIESRSVQSLRIIDKAVANSEFLGIIYSVFPKGRVIYMRRDPIDTCLSCYFQQFLGGLSYTFDLSDLAHYYREHRRLMEHWREVLPPSFILEVPYEGLVAEQEAWSRKMLEFIGLAWDDRCIEFYKNTRPVATASAWQVRQRIYKSSVARWRNYEKFIGPLKSLKG